MASLRVLVKILMLFCISQIVNGQGSKGSNGQGSNGQGSRRGRGPGNLAPMRGNGSGRLKEYIVKLTRGTDVDSFINDFKQRRGWSNGDESHSMRRKFKNVFNGFVAKLNPDDIIELRTDDKVDFLETDERVSINWGPDRVNQRDLPLDGNEVFLGTGVDTHIYIIDTGIRNSHVEFGGRVSQSYNAIQDVDVAGANAVDPHGHGTHCAGIAAGNTYGVAKSATLHAVTVLDASGSGYTSDVIQGMEWVTAQTIAGRLVNPNYAAVASISLGGGASTTENLAVKSLFDSGVVVSVAAGNDNTDACTKSPASAPEAITVAATTSTDTRASYSNYGSCVDIFAPGSSILSAVPTSDTATGYKSGTSMACPHVSGAAAVMLSEFPGATPTEITNLLISFSSKNRVSSAGTGSPNRLLYIGTEGFSTCETRCGEPADDTFDCSCESGCTTDCCNDFQDVCESCATRCFKAPVAPYTTDFCQCEIGCTTNCCDDYASECDSCSNRCNNYDSTKPCQCDTSCASYGDCCIDYTYQCTTGDVCTSNPCEHGTCYNVEGGVYECVCEPGWDGDTCANNVDIDYCSPNPCMNGGTCVPVTNGYTCTCASAWTGTDCDEDAVDQCATTPCQNSGTCVDGNNEYTCTCGSGWTGDICDVIDYCFGISCGNGVCENGASEYTCNCSPGYSGTNCGIDINECETDPCINGGTCHDQVNGYTCDCASGWEGTTCSEDVDECASNPCNNGGTCLNQVNMYTCNCNSGWTGTTCTEDVDECVSNPCINGGTCIDGVNGYTCNCASGWSGTHCGTGAPVKITLTGATQSTSKRGKPASGAIDSDTSTCSETRRKESNWWKADFVSTESCVGEVQLYSLNLNQLYGAKVLIDDVSCGTISSTDVTGGKISLNCNKIGDVIEVTLSIGSKKSLKLCDVKAFTGTCGAK